MAPSFSHAPIGEPSRKLRKFQNYKNAGQLQGAGYKPVLSRDKPHLDVFESSLYSKRKCHYRHPNEYLTERQVKGLFRHAKHAFYAGAPLNRFWTIHLGSYEHRQVHGLISKFLEHSRKWLKQRELPVAYLWTLENGRTIGLHIHLLIHIPRGCQVDYKRAVHKWLTCQKSSPEIHVKEVQYPNWGGLHPSNALYGVLRYICKGIEPDKDLYGITPEYQGPVLGRRCGKSRTLIAC